ncbi:hypothetical protein BD309DRAFT_994316 [Dichomitus squalens]|nr:hypothetical protein BD309DRAFT_994316 [Dichomitus squalens]
MGKLHLEIYVERMKREYNIKCTTGKPRLMEMNEETGKDTEFVNQVMGGNILSNYILACEKGFYEVPENGSLSGNPVCGARLISMMLAFRLATISTFWEVYSTAKPIILEPNMTVDVVAPSEFQSTVIGRLNQHRGKVVDSEVREYGIIMIAEATLIDMFEYWSRL